MYTNRYFCQILMRLGIFLTEFRKNTQMSNFKKIRPVGAELFQPA